MWFHKERVYGSLWRKASPPRQQDAFSAAQVVDDVLHRAKAAAPEVFAKPNDVKAFRQEKLEEVALWLAAASGRLDTTERQQVLEEILDRLEIALREAAVGDVGVSYQMPVLAAALNGRLQRYIPLILKKEWASLTRAAAEHNVPENRVEALSGAYST